MISVENLYYMLAYAFPVLWDGARRRLSAESFAGPGDLLAGALARETERQVRRGLCRDYRPAEERTSRPRGRISFAASLRRPADLGRRLVCQHDEFVADTYPNRILRATLETLAASDISADWRRRIRRLLPCFKDVGALDVRRIDWNMRIDRDRASYKTALSLCRLILEGMLTKNVDGDVARLREPRGPAMHRLYEKFLVGYFRREHPLLHTSSPYIPWATASVDADGLLPTMRTDLVLRRGDISLVVDAKYYADVFQEYRGSRALRSAHLYQILAYVENMAAQCPERRVGGLVLYALPDDCQEIDARYELARRPVWVKTLNLGGPFTGIACQLDAIAKGLL